MWQDHFADSLIVLGLFERETLSLNRFMPTPKRKKSKVAADPQPETASTAAQPEPATALLIEEWPVNRLIPYARNPRIVKQNAIDKVAASLKEFGWRQPIVVDSEEIVVVGHTRLLAALKLGLLTVPVHVARDLTASQAKAYRIADNRTGEETKWAAELLKLEMKDLAAEFANLDIVTGFDVREITKMLIPDLPGADPDADPKEEEDDAKGPALSWGKTKVRITAEEVSLLDQVYEQYVKVNGISYGFIRELVEKAYPELIVLDDEDHEQPAA